MIKQVKLDLFVTCKRGQLLNSATIDFSRYSLASVPILPNPRVNKTKQRSHEYINTYTHTHTHTHTRSVTQGRVGRAKRKELGWNRWGPNKNQLTLPSWFRKKGRSSLLSLLRSMDGSRSPSNYLVIGWQRLVAWSKFQFSFTSLILAGLFSQQKTCRFVVFNHCLVMVLLGDPTVT